MSGIGLKSVSNEFLRAYKEADLPGRAVLVREEAERLAAKSGRRVVNGPECRVCWGDGYIMTESGESVECVACEGVGFAWRRPVRCSTCNDAGVVRHEVPVDHPGFGIGHPCPDCTGGTTVDDILRWASVPPQYTSFSLAKFAELRQDSLQDQVCYELSLMLANSPASFYESVGHRGLFLFGPPGAGKTGLAVGIMRELSKRHIGRMAFATWEYYLESRRPYDTGQDGRQETKGPLVDSQPSESRLMESEIVVLDDVGQPNDKPNPWRAEQMYRILDARIGWGQGVTIITTNLEPEQFRASFGDRAWSRIDGICEIAYVGGGDLRVRDRRVKSAVT